MHLRLICHPDNINLPILRLSKKRCKAVNMKVSKQSVNSLELSGNRNEELYMVQNVYLELLPRSRYTYIRGASDVYSGSSAARCASAAVSQPHQQTPVGIIFPFPTSVLLLLIVPYVLSFAGSVIFNLTSLSFNPTIIY